jgi:hypothetical protein
MKKKQVREINAQLQVLVNQPLRFIFRFLDVICLQFGNIVEKNSRRVVDGKVVVVKENAGEYALHIQSFYRLTIGDTILFASNDAFEPSNAIMASEDYEPGTLDYGKRENNRLDEILDEFFADIEGFTISKIRVNAYADLLIVFSNGARLQAYNDSADTHECWRFFKHNNASDHMVVTVNGVLSEQGHEIT